MPDQVMIVGAGGHARVVLDAFRLRPDEFEVACFTDSNPMLHGHNLYGIPIRGDESAWQEILLSGVEYAHVAVGDNRVRGKLAHKLKEIGFRLANAIHPHAWISPQAHLEQGIAAMAGAVIQAEAAIHECVIVNTGASVDHDCIVERNAHIAPGSHLGGNVHVGEGTLIGIGCSVIPGAILGRWSVIGAGSVVKDEIGSFQIAVGAPARIVKQLSF